MTTPLHAALGQVGSELTFSLVRQACAEKTAETDQLDWKRDRPLPQAGGAGEDGARERTLELAKDIAAMANGRGGLIVYGVREREKGHADKVVGVGDVDDGDLARRIHQVAYNFIYPPVQVACHVLVDDGPDRDRGEEPLQVLVVEVQESDDAPHLVQPKRDGGNDGWLMAPYRAGADTHIMVEKQLESAYRQRFDGRRRRETRLHELTEEIAVRHIAEADLGTGTVIAVAQPTRPRPDALPRRAQSHPHPVRYAQQLLDDGVSTAQVLAHNLIGTHHFPIALLSQGPTHARGLRRHTFTAYRQPKSDGGRPLGRPAFICVELHDDGTIGVLWRRGAAYAYVRHAEEPPPTPGLGLTDLDAVALLVLGLVVSVNDGLELNSDYQLRLRFAPQAPVHLIDETEWHDTRVVSAPAGALDAELRVTGGPDARAADFLAFGQDLAHWFGRERTDLNGFWELPRGSSQNHPRRELARLLFGGEPDHPVTGRSMS